MTGSRLRTGLAMVALGTTTAACGSDAAVSVRYRDAALVPRELVTVWLEDGESFRVLRGEALGSNQAAPREFATATRGTLRLHFRIATASVVASEGAIAVPLRSDWRYSFDVVVDSLDPKQTCFGCQGSRAFPLAAAYRRVPQDSVWIVWGGNSISHPVVY